jgi:Sec-independent protein translocase protein TatA
VPRLSVLVTVAVVCLVIAPVLPAVASAISTETKVARKSPAEKQKEKEQRPKKEAKQKKSDAAAKEKKGHDNTITLNRGTLDPIPVLTRGQTVEIKGTALKTGELCALQIFYSDKPARPIREVVPDEKKRCAFSVTVPDRPGVVGEAKAKLILTKATSGKKSGEARQVFSVN